MLSRVDCIHIHHPNCPFYLEGRYCPEDCEGFVSINPIVKTEAIIDEEENTFKKRK